MATLTQKQIQTMTFAGADVKAADIRWDDQPKGFGVRVWPSGRKTFLIRYRNDSGRRRYLTIGDFGVLTLIHARELAQLRLAEVIRGIDPQEEVRRAAYGETVADVAQAYLERHSAAEKRNYRDDRQKVRDYIDPMLGALKLRQVTGPDLVRMRDRIGYDMPKLAAERAAARAGKVKRGGRKAEVRGGKVCANRVLALFSAIWTWAKDRGVVDAGAPNPAAGVERFPETARDRYVSEDELPRLAAAIKAEKNPFLQALFWLYLLTGMRKSELARIQWTQVDLVRGRLHVGKTKNGAPLHLPLPPAAVAILEGLARYDDNPHVFCGRRHGKPLSGGIHGAWRRIREAAGLGDVRIHDLRHTVASWLVNSGASLPMIGRILNHKNSRTTQRYAHLQLDPAAKELGALSRRMLVSAAGAAPVVLDVMPEPDSAADPGAAPSPPPVAEQPVS